MAKKKRYPRRWFDNLSDQPSGLIDFQVICYGAGFIWFFPHQSRKECHADMGVSSADKRAMSGLLYHKLYGLDFWATKDGLNVKTEGSFVEIFEKNPTKLRGFLRPNDVEINKKQKPFCSFSANLECSLSLSYYYINLLELGCLIIVRLEFGSHEIRTLTN